MAEDMRRRIPQFLLLLFSLGPFIGCGEGSPGLEGDSRAPDTPFTSQVSAQSAQMVDLTLVVRVPARSSDNLAIRASTRALTRAIPSAVASLRVIITGNLQPIIPDPFPVDPQNDEVPITLTVPVGVPLEVQVLALSDSDGILFAGQTEDPVTIPETGGLPDVTIALAPLDRSNPIVLSVDPADGTAKSPLNGSIVITFDEEMEPESIDQESIRVLRNGNQIGGTISCPIPCITATFNPSDPLDMFTAYDVLVTTTVNDISRNNLAVLFTSSFTVGPNRPPVADAGPDQVVNVGNAVSLDGRQSQDPDGDELTFAWSMLEFPFNSIAQLSDPDTISPSVIPDRPGDYAIQLIVSDDIGARDNDTVSIVALPPEFLVADAGPDQMVENCPTLIALNGHDSTGDDLTFDWTFLEFPPTSLTQLLDPATVTPTFVADRSGTYQVQLLVSNDNGTSLPDTISIEANCSIFELPKPCDSPPPPPEIDSVSPSDGAREVPVISSIQVIFTGEMDATTITQETFVLTLSSNPFDVIPGTVTYDPEMRIATLTPGNLLAVESAYIAMVTSGILNLCNRPLSEFSWTFITQTDLPNLGPIADAGPDQSVVVGAMVILDGSGSSDVDGSPLKFTWTLIAKPDGSEAELEGPMAVMPTFNVDRVGTYEAQLIVNNGSQDSEPDIVIITLGKCDVDLDGDIDLVDITLIFDAAVEPEKGPECAAQDNPCDANGDGVITVGDGRACVLLCDNQDCALEP